MLKISIITVVYNRVNYIEQAIKSVLDQNYPNLEYIIIDGGSFDGTQDIIRKYEKDITYWCSEPDNGIYDAMNKGLKRATGDIIGIINSDDWYEKNIMQKVADCFKNEDIDLAYGSIFRVLENGRKEIWPEMPIEQLHCRMTVPHPSVFIRKRIYERYGYFDLQYKLAADYDLLLRLYCNQVKFYNMHMIIANYRVGGASQDHFEVSIRETYKISMKYLPQNTNTQELRRLIKETYKSMLLTGIKKTISLKDLMFKVLNKEIREVVIFGAGYYGEICCSALQREGVKVTAFVDNDEEKWGQTVLEVPVCSPACLESGERIVLIANKMHAQDIINDIQKINNKDLRYVSFDDFEVDMV